MATDQNLDTTTTTVDETEELEDFSAELDENGNVTLPDDPEELKALAEKALKANKSILGRAKKAEARVKDLTKPATTTTTAPAQKPEASEATTQIGVDKRVLLNAGMNPDLLTQLEKIATLNGHPGLIEAQSDPLFVATKENFEKEQKKREGSLPASRGSGASKAKKSLSSPNLSRDEHRAMAQEALEK